jgi:hypothetical protein
MSGTDVLTGLRLENGDLTVNHWQDCEDIIERNKQLQAEPQRSDWGRHIATIPNVILAKWMLEDGVPAYGMSSDEWGRFIMRKLNDPDWRHLRTNSAAVQGFMGFGS